MQETSSKTHEKAVKKIHHNKIKDNHNIIEILDIVKQRLAVLEKRLKSYLTNRVGKNKTESSLLLR